MASARLKRSNMRRTPRRRKSAQGAPEELYFYLGLAVGLSGLAAGLFVWGYPALAQEPNVLVGWPLYALALGWALSALALALIAKSLWRQFAWSKHRKIFIVAGTVVGCAVMAVLTIHAAIEPSFAFIAPGVVVNGDTWLFVVNQRGPQTLYNAEILLVDEDRVAMLKYKTTVTPSDVASSQFLFRLPEIDPKGRGSVFAKQFLWTPAWFEHEHYSVEITTREAKFHEKLQIEKLTSSGWKYTMTVTNVERGKLLLACRDRGFPRPNEARWKALSPSFSHFLFSNNKKLPECFPRVTQP
jgi:hypothetical protein